MRTRAQKREGSELAQILTDVFGSQEARLLLEVNETSAPFTLRVNALSDTRNGMMEKLKERFPSITFACGKYSPQALVLSEPIDLFHDELYLKGNCSLQDESLQLISLALAPKSSMTILDALASGGDRSMHMGELMRNLGTLHVWGREPGELETIEREAARLGISLVRTRIKDPTTIVRQKFDAALIYAPSSGIGMARRNRLLGPTFSLDALQGVTALQQKILHRVAPGVKKGGRLVYAVSSYLPVECEEAVFRFLETFKMFGIDQLNLVLPPSCYPLVDEHGFFKAFPRPGQMDGVFIAALRKY